MFSLADSTNAGCGCLLLVGLGALITLGISRCVNRPPATPPPPPPPPASLTELTEPFASYPFCDSSIPACKVKEQSANEAILPQLASISSPGIQPLVMRIDSISQQDRNTWNVSGDVVWDEAADQNSAAFGIGAAAAGLSLLGGRSPLGAIVDGTSVGKSLSTDQADKCLTSADPNFKGFGEITLYIKDVRLSTLDGFEEGKYLRVDLGSSLLPFRKGDSIFDTERSKFFPPSNFSGGKTGFGTVRLNSQGTSAEVVPSPKLYEYCPPARSASS